MVVLQGGCTVEFFFVAHPGLGQNEGRNSTGEEGSGLAGRAGATLQEFHSAGVSLQQTQCTPLMST